ncbi:MAG: 2-oxo acid dehydrogenase subunit E2 [Spirochaetaceae bacterium]|nr:2-oxo acid dehydrogenase subunit E2 [Spirochaetaceae bacterium]
MERIVDGDKVPIMTLIRKAESKSVETVTGELREAATRPIAGSADYTPAERKNRRMERIFFYMPGALRRVVWRMLMRNPFSVKKNMGSLVITNIGMSGRTSGWILPKSMYNLSIVKKPCVVMGEVAVRDTMNLTIVFDHDVIDGAPAARFADTLVKLMESAEGL